MGYHVKKAFEEAQKTDNKCNREKPGNPSIFANLRNPSLSVVIQHIIRPEILDDHNYQKLNGMKGIII